jgi:antitoxin (DNA-binding transcriptional repressor) of toxin-antitoxin stability system
MDSLSMNEVALADAKNRLSELIDRVQAGEVITITRRGKVVAQLARPDAGAGAARALDAVTRLRAARAGVSLGGLTSRELIGEGRR